MAKHYVVHHHHIHHKGLKYPKQQTLLSSPDIPVTQHIQSFPSPAIPVIQTPLHVPTPNLPVTQSISTNQPGNHCHGCEAAEVARLLAQEVHRLSEELKKSVDRERDIERDIERERNIQTPLRNVQTAPIRNVQTKTTPLRKTIPTLMNLKVQTPVKKTTLTPMNIQTPLKVQNQLPEEDNWDDFD